MNLSKGVLNYLKGLLCVFENANCVSLAKISECSHDSLSRILNTQDLRWQILHTNFVLRTFEKLQGGYLIIDDTVISKSFAKKIENLSWVYDSEIKRCVLGLNIVTIAWSDGKITLPLAIRIYQKESKKTKIDLAIELLEYAKSLKIKADYVTFDSWYAADKLFQKINECKWIFITRLKKNRKLDKVPLNKTYQNPYWIKQGKLTSGLKVSVVRHGRKYFATNSLSLSKQEIIALYRGRWLVETIFRMLHSKLGIDECESRSLQSQSAHFHLCLMAYTVLEKEKFIVKKTIYQIKRECSFNFKKADYLLNSICFQGA